MRHWMRLVAAIDADAGLLEAATPERPTLFYRGTEPGRTERIRTGDGDWDRRLFVSSVRKYALDYGSHITVYRAKPTAKILYEGTAAFRSLAKGLKHPGFILPSVSEMVRRAEAAGYDAVWFKLQGGIGTAIIHPAAFEIIPDPAPEPTDR